MTEILCVPSTKEKGDVTTVPFRVMETDARPEMASLDNTVTVAPALVCQLPLCAPEVLLVMTGVPGSKWNAILPVPLDSPDVAEIAV